MGIPQAGDAPRFCCWRPKGVNGCCSAERDSDPAVASGVETELRQSLARTSRVTLTRFDLRSRLAAAGFADPFALLRCRLFGRVDRGEPAEDDSLGQPVH
jgi:hypothetical protein